MLREPLYPLQVVSRSDIKLPDQIIMQEPDAPTVEEVTELPSASPVVQEEITTEAEGELASDELQLRDQARSSRVPEEGESLLKE